MKFDMGSPEGPYKPLLKEAMVSEERLVLRLHPNKAACLRIWALSWTHLATLYIINICLLTTSLYVLKMKQRDPTLDLYSPANPAVEYKLDTVVGGFAFAPVNTPYMGDSNKTDRLWEDLYQNGVTLISKEEAAQLPQKTDHILGHEDKFPVILGVFHKLHCLNRIRKSLYPETYGKINTADVAHLVHCVDLLRQTVMCQSDVSIGFFRRTEGGELLPQADVQRVCRNFDKVKEWADSHHAKVAVG